MCCGRRYGRFWGGAFLLIAGCASPVLGARIEGVSFAESVRVNDTRLKLVGTGLQRYMLLYKVCVAGLYLPESARPAEALSDIPKRLEISYFHRIDAVQFATLTRKGVRQNVSPVEFARVSRRLEALMAAYRSVDPGDRYALTYLPGRGVTLCLNGREVITLEGADFARALYAVWLGDKPVTEGLKAGLLGQ